MLNEVSLLRLLRSQFILTESSADTVEEVQTASS